MPQPIDPHTELARVTALERVQQAMDRASLAAQARTAQEHALESVRAETHVDQTRQKQEQVERDLRRRNPYRGRRKRRQESEAHLESPGYNAHSRLDPEIDQDEHSVDFTA